MAEKKKKNLKVQEMKSPAEWATHSAARVEEKVVKIKQKKKRLVRRSFLDRPLL
jgi:hypothetical protein